MKDLGAFYHRSRYPHEKLALGRFQASERLVLLDENGIEAFNGTQSLFLRCVAAGYFMPRSGEERT